MNRDDDRRRPDPRARPSDPAGTRPKPDPPTPGPAHAPPGPRAPDVVDGDAVELGPGSGPGVADGDLLPERRRTAGVGPVDDGGPRVPPPHASRFNFLYGALAALGIAAVAAAVVALAGGGRHDEASLVSWSSWRPTDSAVGGANQIADHVEGRYRLSGRQLVQVKASGLDFEGVPLTVALRETPAQGGDIRVFDGDGLIYRLCGLGANCAIDFGKPSTQRLLLLRREALELALYSFRYLDVDQVVVFMPPAPKAKPSQAVFFRRGDVARQLARPLTASLGARTPSVRTITRAADTSLVDRLTGLFSFSLTQGNT